MAVDTKPVTTVEEIPPTTSGHAASVDTKDRKLTWKGYIWDTLDMPPAERRLLLKVRNLQILIIMHYEDLCLTHSRLTSQY
jgi:hypothetical protein